MNQNDAELVKRTMSKAGYGSNYLNIFDHSPESDHKKPY